MVGGNLALKKPMMPDMSIVNGSSFKMVQIQKVIT